MNQYIIATIGFLGFGTLLGSLEVLSRKFSLPPELIRRISHISGALFTIFFSFYLSAYLLLAILGIFTIIMFISRLLKVFNHIHAVSRPTIGEELLPIGFIAAYLISNGNSTIFVPSILIVGVADPITGIVMQKYKKHSLGILVFALVSIPLLMLFSQAPIWMSIMIAVVVSLVERISSYGTDNLSIPVSVALLLLYIK